MRPNASTSRGADLRRHRNSFREPEEMSVQSNNHTAGYTDKTIVFDGGENVRNIAGRPKVVELPSLVRPDGTPIEDPRKKGTLFMQSRGSVQTESPGLGVFENNLKHPVKITRRAYGLNSEYNYNPKKEGMSGYQTTPAVNELEDERKQRKKRRRGDRVRSESSSGNTGQFGDDSVDLEQN